MGEHGQRRLQRHLRRAEQRRQLGQLRGRRIRIDDSGRAHQTFDHGIERLGLVIGRALPAGEVVRPVENPIVQGLGQARLAHAGFGEDQHGPPRSLTSRMPAVGEQGEFGLAPDE